MARPRLPTNVHELKGTGKVHPERMRERENEPKDDRDLGKAPGWLDAEEKKAWKEITDHAIPGVLKKVDALSVAMAAQLLAKCKAREASGQEQNLLYRYLAQFGMTPADRSKIQLPQSGGGNPFAEE